MNNKFKIGDYVTRKKYNNDILFRIDKIIKNKYILSGVDLRLFADSNESDLVLSGYSNDNDSLNTIEINNENDYNYLPGKILHIDGDKNYLKRCMDFYNIQKIKCFGYVIDEKNIKNEIINLIKKHDPDIVVITGHDSFTKNKYRNSKFFIDAVKKIMNNYSNLIIIAGACQSDYIGLIKSGATFASSPKRINIHALDPAIVASIISKSESNKIIDIKKLLSSTKCGSDGFGGFVIFGSMKKYYPRII